jgi:hypothetical protein
MRHKFIVLAGIAALALVLAACGGAATQGGAQQPAGGAGQATRPDLVVATPTPTAPGAPTSTPIGGGQAYVVMPPARATTAPTEEATEEAPEVVALDATAGTGEALDQAWGEAFALPPETPFTITISQEELTAALANRLAGVEAVKSVEATLADGQITLDLALKIEGRDVIAKAVFSVAVDEEGQAVVEVVSAEVTGAQGGVSINIPDEVLSTVNDTLAQALIGAGAQNQVDVTFTEITIANGTMILSGYVAP